MKITYDQEVFYLACMHNDMQIINDYIKRGLSVSYKVSEYGFTPLHIACYYGHEQVVSVLLQNGAWINEKMLYGNTPLHCAIERKHKNVALLLLEKGADPNIPNNRNLIPLHYAAYLGYHDIVKLLMEYGSDTSVICNDSGIVGTPVDIAKNDAIRELMI